MDTMNQTPVTQTRNIPGVAHAVRIAASPATVATPAKSVLLRQVIGDQLRARRLEQGRTLREVSRTAQVSLGYLSEVERGHKIGRAHV